MLYEAIWGSSAAILILLSAENREAAAGIKKIAEWQDISLANVQFKSFLRRCGSAWLQIYRGRPLTSQHNFPRHKDKQHYPRFDHPIDKARK